MVKKYQLKNGMNILLAESHKSPVVTIQMWVKTGSADERKGEEGISHFIEHLLFKGTKNFGVGEVAEAIEGAGGQLNAYTSFDETVFYVTLSKTFLTTGLEVISEMMGHPTFDADEIDREREVVLEEIKRTHDNPHRRASRLLFSSAYKKHPYKFPVIGYEENIRSVTRDEILSYYESRYVPKNMTLVVAGDVSHKELKPLVGKYFSSFYPHKLRAVKRPVEPPRKRSEIKVEKSDFERTLIHFSWPTPKVTHKDIAALDVLTFVLGGGDSSRLMRAMRIERPLTQYTSASLFAQKDPGFLAISMALNIDNSRDALEQLNVELERILKEPPSHSELRKAVTNFESDEIYSLETVDGMARKFGSYDYLFSDYRRHKEFLKVVSSLEPKDLTKVARKYLKPDKILVASITPEKDEELKNELKFWKRNYTKIFNKIKAKRLQDIKKEKVKGLPKVKWAKGSASPEFRKIPLVGGAYLERISEDVPVFNIRCASLAGVRLENDHQGGLTELFARVWCSQSSKRSEKEVHEKVDSLAAHLSPFGGRNTVGLSMTSLEVTADEMLDLYFELLLDSQLSSEIMERERAIMKEQRKQREDRPEQKCVLNFLASMYQGHPYGRDPMGSAESLEQMTVEHLDGYRRNFLKRENISFALSGYIGSRDLESMVKSKVDELASGHPQANSFVFTPPSSEVRVGEKMKREQSHIIVGYPGITFQDEDRYGLQVVQAILAGQGGRLFRELRDKASLAYSISPLRMDGIDAGHFGGYIACSPNKTETAIGMLKEEFHKLATTRPSEDELEKAKRNLIGRHDIDLQRNSSISASLLFDYIYGLDPEETFNYKGRIADVTSADILKISQRIFAAPCVISIVGPKYSN